MKKLMSLIGVLMFGATAMAQVSKTDSSNKVVSRKVMESDVKSLPDSAAAKEKGKEIKGSVTQKGRENGMIQKGREGKMLQKGKGAKVD